jgi:tetratricopeptide (TPR) repeat protein
VPTGYEPPPARPRAAPPSGERAAPAGRAPAPRAPGAAYGLGEPEVTADAAIAAGLPLEGSLAKDGALRLFYLAAATQAHGRLTISAAGGEYALTFRRGTVEHAASSAPEDDLLRFLYRKGALAETALVDAEAAREAACGDVVGGLIAARLVNPAEVAGHLQEHGAALVARALGVEAGTFAWEPGATPPASSFPLGAPFAMLCAAVRALDVAAVQRRLGDREGRAARRVGGRVRVEDLRLTPQEARAVGLFDGRSPAQIAAAQAQDAPTILRLALLLGETELLAFGAPRIPASPAAPVPAAAPPAATPPPAAIREPPGAKSSSAVAKSPPPARTPVAPAKPALTPAPAVTPAPRAPAPSLEPAALEELLRKFATADHYAVLGVKRDAGPAQVKIAYFQLAKSYHPDAVPAGAPAGARALCADIFARVSEAWRVLGNEAERAAYLALLESGGAADVDVMRIFAAENTFQVGTALVRSRKYDEALAKFDEALQLNAEEPEFGMWKAWCEYLVAADKKRQGPASTQAIEAGLKKNARCAPGYLFLAQIAKLSGELGAAEKHLRRGLAMAPDDAELARELKYLKK